MPFASSKNGQKIRHHRKNKAQNAAYYLITRSTGTIKNYLGKNIALVVLEYAFRTAELREGAAKHLKTD